MGQWIQWMSAPPCPVCGKTIGMQEWSPWDSTAVAKNYIRYWCDNAKGGCGNWMAREWTGGSLPASVPAPASVIGKSVLYRNPDACSPEERAEWSRKFGKCLLSDDETKCVDCGLGWGKHTWFYCYAAHSSSWKPGTILHSAADASGRVTYADYLGSSPAGSAIPPSLVTGGSGAISTGVKEEGKMFQVTTYLFASGIVSNASYPRLEDAQAGLEKIIATYKQAGPAQAKTFFTASILDTRTGKYYGFITEAPPAIKLEGASE